MCACHCVCVCVCVCVVYACVHKLKLMIDEIRPIMTYSSPSSLL